MTETMNGRFQRWFNGDEDAVHFALSVWQATQEWDDLEDEGRCEDHNRLLSWLAFGKEYTPFFARNAHLLRPALLQLYLRWRVANVLERGDRDDVNKAYMLRAGYYDVLHMIAWICGGDDHAARVGPEIYRSYGETAEGLWKEFNDG